MRARPPVGLANQAPLLVRKGGTKGLSQATLPDHQLAAGYGFRSSQCATAAASTGAASAQPLGRKIQFEPAVTTID